MCRTAVDVVLLLLFSLCKNAGSYPFSGCDVLTNVTCRAEMPPTPGQDVFARCNALASIQVPATSVDNYQAAEGWKEYADLITAIPEQ